MGPDPSGLSSLEQGSCALCGLCPLEAIRWYLETFVVTTREWKVLVPGVEANVVHTLVTISQPDEK